MTPMHCNPLGRYRVWMMMPGVNLSGSQALFNNLRILSKASAFLQALIGPQARVVRLCRMMDCEA